MSTPASRTIWYRHPSIGLYYISRCELAITLVAFVTIMTCPLWLWALFFTDQSRYYEYTSSLICVPLLASVAALAIMYFTQTDRYLRRLLMTGMVARMAASSLFLWVGMVIYGAATDAFHYWNIGLQMAERFKEYGWSVFQPPYWSTNLIMYTCAVATAFIGNALPTLFIAFAFVPLVGGYLYYRAFTAAFPDGDRWLFGLLAVLSPSLLFWSSFIGKDALIQFFIALTCFGFAKVTQRQSFGGALVSAAGLAGILLVRAHVAAIVGIAMTFPYLVGRSRAAKRDLLVRRIILVPILLGATYFLVTQARTFLTSSIGNDETASVLQSANTATKNSQIGGSAFNQGSSLPVRIAESPFLMFRPFPWEINNTLALASAVEALGWMILCWVRRREIWWTLQHWRDPYVGFLLMYAIVFSITFGASLSNFGLLARQRIMMMPIVFMLLCAQPKLQTPGSSRRLKAARAYPLDKVSASARIPTKA